MIKNFRFYTFNWSEFRGRLQSQLRELEEEGFISREVYPVVAPKVEYSITKRGKKAIVIVDAIRNYGLDLMKEFGVEHSKVEKHKKEK